jgi:transcriptional regulator with XRE-family HTH domain
VNIGRAIRLCRSQRAMTQTELARRSGLSVAYVSLIEQNKRDPSFSMLESLARGLEVPLSIITFLGADKNDLAGISDDLREKLSKAALDLLKEPSSGFLV